MADEFTAALEAKDQISLVEISRDLSALGRYFCERSSQNEAALRFTLERRPDWPEDYTISYEGDVLFVVIHVGNRLQREAVLEDIRAVFIRHGVILSLEPV